MSEPAMLHDYTRCHDHVCPQKTQCLRYLRRHTAAAHANHVATLRIAQFTCTKFIQA